MTSPRTAPGPFRPEQLREGDRYELSGGHPLWCAPAGGQHSRGSGLGFSVLESDPDVKEAGVDPGYQLGERTLRAPDVGVGNVPNRPGWIQGAPPLALEYSDTGQDEAELQGRIDDLLSAGTKQVWVVRLVGPRRVEVYEPGRAVRTVLPGGVLTAPGVLRNPVPVEALWDKPTAHAVTLRNLLQREGYRDLDAILEDGRQEGLERGLEQGLERGLEQGLERGLEQGLEPLARQFERRLQRALTAEERASLVVRLRALGPARLGDVVLDLDATALGAWLADPDAR